MRIRDLQFKLRCTVSIEHTHMVPATIPVLQKSLAHPRLTSIGL